MKANMNKQKVGLVEHTHWDAGIYVDVPIITTNMNTLWSSMQYDFI